MQGRKYFTKLEKFIGSKIPEYIVNFLIDAGYDEEIALRGICAETITTIENHLNLEEKKFLLIGTVYERAEKVSLLPGHKSIILNIPSYIESFISNKRNKSNVRIQKEQFESPAESEKSSEQLDELKEKCLKKLQNYAKCKSVDLNITEICFSNFECIAEDEYKYRFDCPACSKSHLCQFKKYWRVSNIQAHLKTHASIIPIENSEISDLINQANLIITKKTV